MLYPVELRALTTRCNPVEGGRVQTQKVDSAWGSVNPTECVAEQFGTAEYGEKKNPRHLAGGNRMGGTRLELVTSTMSTWRSNQLS
jgi:hypothetical protein